MLTEQLYWLPAAFCVLVYNALDDESGMIWESRPNHPEAQSNDMRFSQKTHFGDVATMLIGNNR